MRPDFEKLLCERERRGSGASYERSHNDRHNPRYAYDDEVDDYPAFRTTQSMKRLNGKKYDSKELNENLNVHADSSRAESACAGMPCSARFARTSRPQRCGPAHLPTSGPLRRRNRCSRLRHTDLREPALPYCWRSAPQRRNAAGREQYTDWFADRFGILRRNAPKARWRKQREARRREKEQKKLDEERHYSDGTWLKRLNGAWFRVWWKNPELQELGINKQQLGRAELRHYGIANRAA